MKKKKLVIINGTMGVGKTTVCKLLYKELRNSVWLDGDWCWMMNPFVVNDENKNMATKNISFLLKSFLENSSYEYVIFCWVIHQYEILENLLSELSAYDYELFVFTLQCTAEKLEERMLNDERESDNIEKSMKRLDLYNDMKTVKIDTSNLTPLQTMNIILEKINQ